LNEIGLAEPGFDSTLDITACPGTDTCNLGIASSMGLAKELEKMLTLEYQELIFEKDIKIKISGCMNACAQHTIANIGLHGMSLKVGKFILPAMQVLLGGGIRGNGEGSIADKVIKLPTKRVPEALRRLLNDYKTEGLNGEQFNDYYHRQGKNYFYTLLKPVGEISEVIQDDLIDWGNEAQYETLIGVGECAGSMVDMVSLVIDETREKLEKAEDAYNSKDWVNAIYYTYSSFINSAKAFLLSKNLTCNTHLSVLNNFNEYLTGNNDISYNGNFKDNVLKMNKNTPSQKFALDYYIEAQAFYLHVIDYRKKQMAETDHHNS
jgi:sulfite reductase (ferredoxin)